MQNVRKCGLQKLGRHLLQGFRGRQTISLALKHHVVTSQAQHVSALPISGQCLALWWFLSIGPFSLSACNKCQTRSKPPALWLTTTLRSWQPWQKGIWFGAQLTSKSGILHAISIQQAFLSQAARLFPISQTEASIFVSWKVFQSCSHAFTASGWVLQRQLRKTAQANYLSHRRVDGQ